MPIMRTGGPLDRPGSRCHICTGCGRCGIGGAGLDILGTDPGGADPWLGAGRLEGRLRNAAAIDVGTTTLALEYWDGQGVKHSFATANPQIAYGADVMSRIDQGQDGLKRAAMQSALKRALARGLDSFPERPAEICLAGNTAMTYILRGLDTAELGHAPFAAGHLEASVLDIGGHKAHCMPGLSAFVGGDLAAGIYALDLWESEELVLLVDLGTNGELVLGNKRRLLAAATAAGPAFEGGASRGIWGSDMVSLLARLRAEGLVDETGLLAEPYFHQGIRIGDVEIRQEAIRGFQLAKGAVAAGIGLLAGKFGLRSLDQIDRVVLSGGFGYYVEPGDAAAVGLLPAGLEKRACKGGNTSLLGAALWAADRLEGNSAPMDAMTAYICDRHEAVNLAMEPDFASSYLEAMQLEAVDFAPGRV